MAVLFKNDRLASEWARRNSAQEAYVTIPNGDDVAYATGQMNEFDEVMDYNDAVTKRGQHVPNAYIADGKQAEGEANLIMAAFHGEGPRAERARLRLVELGYAL